MPLATEAKPPIKYFGVALQDNKLVHSFPTDPQQMDKRVCTTIYAVTKVDKRVLVCLFRRRNNWRRNLAKAANLNHPLVWRLDVNILQCNARPILTVWPHKHMWRGYTIVCQCRWTEAIIEVDVGPTAAHCFAPIFDVHPSTTGTLCQMVARGAILTCMTPNCGGEVYGSRQLCQRCELIH